MAVADPRLEEWEEWKDEMEKRMTRWRERVSRWPEVQAGDGADEEEEEEEEVEEEAKETNSEDEEASEDKEETEAGETGEEEGDEGMEREAWGVDAGEGRRVTEIESGDEEEEGERKGISEVTEIEEARGKGENEEEEEEDTGDEKEDVREDSESEEGGMGKEERDEMEMEIREAQEMDVEEGRGVMEIKNVDEEEEVEEEVERKNINEDEKEEDIDNEKEEVREDTETGEGGMGKEEEDEMEMRKKKEMDVEEERRVMEIKNGDEEEDNDVEAVTEREEARGNGEKEDGEEEEEEDIDNEKEEVREDPKFVEGRVGKEEGDEMEMEMREAQEMDVEEERRVLEMKNVDEVEEEEGGEEEGERKNINEDEEEEDIDDEKEEVREVRETGEGGIEKEEEEDEMETRKEKEMEEEAVNEVGAGVEVDEERVEEKVEELEEEVGKEAARNVNEAIMEDEEEDGDMKESREMREAREDRETELEREVRKRLKEQREYEEVQKIVEYYLAETRREQMREAEDENLQHGEGSTREEETVDEDEDAPESVSESRTTPDERSQEELRDEEEDDADYEEADDDVDDYDEEEVKVYRKDDHLAGLFGALATFRDASLLTDLALSTVDGGTLHVHSLVMAAVSLRVRESLRGGGGEEEEEEEEEEGGGGVRRHRRSLALGPEVDRVGLEAVVAFAYTGLVPRLDEEDAARRIAAAADALRAPRVLERCAAGDVKEDGGASAEEQMATSLGIIERLRRDRVGCDVVLEAVGGSLHVHRVILAVWSDYFRSMFTLGMKESHQPRVTLPSLLASELQVLIDFSYGGALPLSWGCVFEITGTSLQLQCEATLSLGLRFLRQEMNPRSCLDVASFAEAYEMAPLLEVADDFVLHHFQKVARTPKFKDLPFDKLLRYLNSLSLCVPSELVVFKAVAAWIQARPRARRAHAQEMMKSIHFTLMTFREFKEVQTQDMWSDHSQAELFGEICENFCSSEDAPQSQCRRYLPKESLVLVGGDETSEDLSSRSISRELWFGNSLQNHTGIRKAVEWRRLGEMPDAPRFSHEVAVLKGQLYVFGGKNYYGTDDTLSSVCRYDPLRDSWEGLAAMQERRCSFSAVVLDGKIYAVGGHHDPDYLETVEQYSPVANAWRFTCPLDLPQRAHVAKVSQGKIFVSGGMFSDSQCLSHMFQYHPETGSTYLAEMANPRANHCMEVMGDRLYVAGGVTVGDVIQIVDQLSCEVYSPAADSWTAFACLPVPHVGAGSAVLEGKFYVLGGYSHEEYSDTKTVHRYDPAVQRWENMGAMPGPNNDIRASLLRLPPHFRL